MTEKTDIRATSIVEPPFNGLQFEAFLSFNAQFQGFKVSNLSIGGSKGQYEVSGIHTMLVSMYC
jgi:hypothetical protein